MKFSVLLPTRNGLPYLKHAVLSVIKQKYDNWELVISDNASDEPVAQYIHSLNDQRIIYSRSDEFLTVTQNWNRCLSLCSGDYILMLGDDDILLQNYFCLIIKLIQDYNQPELIYTKSYIYVYPKTILSSSPLSSYFRPFDEYVDLSNKPYFFSRSECLNIVQKTINFHGPLPSNMQHMCIKNSLIERTKKKGVFFHSPYPDFYAMPVLFLNAKEVLRYPKEALVVGVTPKSHGYYFFNDKDKEGSKYLNIEQELSSIKSLKNILIPFRNNNMTNYSLGAYEMVVTHFPTNSLKINYSFYRKIASRLILQQYLNDKREYQNDFKDLMACLSFVEKCQYIYLFLLKRQLKKRFPTFIKLAKNLLSSINSAFKEKDTDSHQPEELFLKKNETKYCNASEIFDNIVPEHGYTCSSSVKKN